MPDKSLMEKTLGADWDKLPPALKNHYQAQRHTDIGSLNISYPPFMQPYLNLLYRLGALINRRGRQLPTRVEKTMHGNIQVWTRSICFPDNRHVIFKSYWETAGDHQIIEYVNSFLGLKMRLAVENQELHYQGLNFIIKLGWLMIPVPEWLLLGHTRIIEKARDDEQFCMDFRLHHPWLGELYRYRGCFHTTAEASPDQ